MGNPPPVPTIEEIAGEAGIHPHFLSVALEHVSGLAASAPDTELLHAAHALAIGPGDLLVALLEMQKELHRHNGAANGRKSGEKRRSACAWAYVDERAPQIWAANRSLSRKRIAELVGEKWPANLKRPSDRALYEHVRAINLT
jgi:hypothetical protein